MKNEYESLHIKIRTPLKNKAKRAAKAEELTLTQWVSRTIAAKLLQENKP